jgi:hypothetical protein
MTADEAIDFLYVFGESALKVAIAAQNTKESAQHIPQQTNGKITPHICEKIEWCHNAGGKNCGSHKPCYTV